MFKNIAEKNSNSRKTIPSNSDKSKPEAFSNPREKGTNQIGEEINLLQDKPNSSPAEKQKPIYPNPVVKSIPAKMPKQATQSKRLKVELQLIRPQDYQKKMSSNPSHPTSRQH